FMVEARYRGAKIVSIFPDYAEGAKFGDVWLHPKQGTDAALALAMGHVILKEFHLEGRSEYFREYCRQYSDMPFLVRLVRQGDRYVPERMLRAADFPGAMGQANSPEWKPVACNDATGEVTEPAGSIGFRWGQQEGGDLGKWNLDAKDADGNPLALRLSLVGAHDEVVPVAFPYFGGRQHDYFQGTDHPEVLERNMAARRVQTVEGEVLAVTVYDLLMANYGLDRGLGGANVATSYDDDAPYTPAWQEQITGVKREDVITVARQFAETADKTRGKSMVILGAGLNHWYHMDMAYRGIINLVVMCGCVGKSGGGWCHYVGQEKLRPQTGWTTLAFGLDWCRPPRHMNGTSFFYAHTDQWRYEKLKVSEILSPLAETEAFQGELIDFNVRAERMGWLPSAPQLQTNPLQVARDAQASGQTPADYVVQALRDGRLKLSCED